MGTKFKVLSTVIMFLLILLLIGIFVNYYNEPIQIKDNNVVVSTNPPKEIKPVISIQKESGDNITTLPSGEINSGENFKPEDKVINDITPKDSQIIISSDSVMTNKEKKDILTELDSTLMDLLKVVDSVQTVDESRLITEESEVQQ